MHYMATIHRDNRVAGPRTERWTEFNLDEAEQWVRDQINDPKLGKTVIIGMVTQSNSTTAWMFLPMRDPYTEELVEIEEWCVSC